MNIVGNATRECIGDQMWGNTDVLQCQSLTIMLIAEEVCVLNKVPCLLYNLLKHPTQAHRRLPPANQKLESVTEEQVVAAVTVSEELAMATMRGLETGLFPRDLNYTNNVVKQVSLLVTIRKHIVTNLYQSVGRRSM